MAMVYWAEARWARKIKRGVDFKTASQILILRVLPQGTGIVERRATPVCAVFIPVR